MAQKILIFIPAKDEASTIGGVIEGAREEFKKMGLPDPDVLVINDGSKDQTADIARNNSARVISHEWPQGLGNVFAEGVENAIADGYDIMLTIDGDGQFASSDIPRLLKPLLDGQVDFVTGSRFSNGSTVSAIPKAKKIGNRWMSLLISSIIGKRFKDVSCGFRAYNREALLHLNVFGAFTYTQEVFLNLGVKKVRIKEVPINVQYFKERRSRIAHSILKYALQTSKIIFRSLIIYKPMKLFGSLASLTFAIGIPVTLVLGVRYLLTDLISPFKGIAITALILIVLGLSFLVAGIILEISSRIQLSIERTMYYARKKS